MQKLTREVKIYPAFDKRNPDPAKNYGIKSMDLKFLIKGDKGVVQFYIITNWNLPQVQIELDNKIPDTRFPYWLHKPMAADLGYHSYVPLYDGQKTMGPCEYLDGKDCYYDGSGLNAEGVFKTMVMEGGEAMWKELEDYYYETFEPLEVLK